MNMKSSTAAAPSAAPSPATCLSRPAVARWAATCAALACLGATTAAQAGVEFVTNVDQCTKVDTIGDGKDLRLPPGPNVRFEVWGSGIDINPAVSGGFGARIVSKRSGATNAGKACKIATGSVVVEVGTLFTATTNVRRTLQFRMPLGDLSPLAVTVLTLGTSVNHVWPRGAQNIGCLGTALQDLNDDRLTISLPPGAQTNTSNCTASLTSNVSMPGSPSPNIVKQPSFNYEISPLPAWMTKVAGSESASFSYSAAPRYTVDALALRRITTQQNIRITATAPNGRADSVTLVVNPGPPNGFVRPVVCGVSGQARVGEVFNCEARLAVTPPAAGQLLTFHAPSAACFEPAASNMTYSASTGVGTVTLPATGTIHQIPLRARNGTGCTSISSSVGHVLKFWIGPRGDETGPLFSSAQISIAP